MAKRKGDVSKKSRRPQKPPKSAISREQHIRTIVLTLPNVPEWDGTEFPAKFKKTLKGGRMKIKYGKRWTSLAQLTSEIKGRRTKLETKNFRLKGSKVLASKYWETPAVHNQPQSAGGDLDDVNDSDDSKSDGHNSECAVCNDGGDLVCCDFCENACHLGCVGLEKVPEGDWHCPECTKTRA